MAKILHSRFTIPNFTKDQEIALRAYFQNKNNQCSYLCYIINVNESEDLLLEGYIQWKIPTLCETLAREWKARFSTAKTNAIENITLFQEIENEAIESNLLVEMGNFRDIEVKISARRWEKALKCIEDKEFLDINSDIFIKYHRNIMILHTLNQEKPAHLEGELQNLWIWGPSGSGKSRLARMIANGKVYPKNKSKHWHNYQGEDWVIIENIEISDQWIGNYLRMWGDRYEFNAEKGESSEYIRPKHILVTSRYSINEIFSEEKMNGSLEMLNALTRRFRSEFLSSLGNEPLTIRQLTEVRDKRWKNWEI